MNLTLPRVLQHPSPNYTPTLIKHDLGSAGGGTTEIEAGQQGAYNLWPQSIVVADVGAYFSAEHVPGCRQRVKAFTRNDYKCYLSKH